MKEQNSHKILFLSALDFKEKSIQVISKTPEAFVQAGWDVTHIVARDTSKYGNYFYEREINPTGVHVQRFYMPLKWLRDSLSSHTLNTIASKIAGYITIIKIARRANKFLKNNSVDVIYGYETHGILALKLLRLLRNLKGIKTVHRFQGTWLSSYKLNKQYIKLFLNLEALWALKIKSDLVIMTNDGTQGNYFFKKKSSFKFWVNGVDKPSISQAEVEILNKLHKPSGTIIALTVCRLESWKRVERGIMTISKLVNYHKIDKIKYLIVGDGQQKEKIENLIKEEKIEQYVQLLGSKPQSEVNSYLAIADYFISTYDLSNVGNPLLEAIRANKIIFTLNNGDTASWIQHKHNGFIYDINNHLIETMATDMVDIINNPSSANTIIDNIKKTEKDKLWTWEERFKAEVESVKGILNS